MLPNHQAAWRCL